MISREILDNCDTNDDDDDNKTRGKLCRKSISQATFMVDVAGVPVGKEVKGVKGGISGVPWAHF